MKECFFPFGTSKTEVMADAHQAIGSSILSYSGIFPTSHFPCDYYCSISHICCYRGQRSQNQLPKLRPSSRLGHARCVPAARSPEWPVPRSVAPAHECRAPSEPAAQSSGIPALRHSGTQVGHSSSPQPLAPGHPRQLRTQDVWGPGSRLGRYLQGTRQLLQASCYFGNCLRLRHQPLKSRRRKEGGLV